jgi:hypothetical protein
MVNSGALVDSYTSGNGLYGGSNIGSNGNVVAAGTITNNGGVINGQQSPNTPSNLPMPTIPSNAVNLPVGSSSPGSLYINQAADSVTLAPGSYVVQWMNVNYPGAINISPAGPVTIYVTGGLNLGGNENHGGSPANLTFVVTSSNWVNVNSNGTLVGNIYAPTSGINLNSTVDGYVAGSSVNLNSGAAVHYDMSEACPAFGSGQASMPPVLVPPPTEDGCYSYSANRWVRITCAAQSTIDQYLGHLDVDQGLQTPNANHTTSTTPLVFGQVEVKIVNSASESDLSWTTGNLTCNWGNFQNPVSNKWGVQANTNFYHCNYDSSNPNGDYYCATQFTVQQIGNSGQTGVCITQANGGKTLCDQTPGDQTYHQWCITLTGVSDTSGDIIDLNSRVGPLCRNGSLVVQDYANVGGWTFTNSSGAHVGLVAQFSWYSTNDNAWPPSEPYHLPGYYAIVAPDVYGLGNQMWTTVTGNIMGFANSSQAQFTNTGVVTRVVASSCPGDITPDSPTCSSTPQLTNLVTSAQNQTTAETNNLTLVADSATAPWYPNKDLVVMQFMSSTNTDGSCWVDTNSSGATVNHVYVKDNDGDNGGVPSNAGGAPFWESPDIFVYPHSQTPQPPGINDVSSDWVVSPSQSYDIYVRVHNDGCNPVGNLQAALLIGNADLGLTSWKPVTNGYSSKVVPPYSNTVGSNGGEQILGPFVWTASSTDSGHMCLMAAIQADGETGPSATSLPPAYSDPRVAQRNLQFTSNICNFSVTNSTSDSAGLGVWIRVPPSSPAVSKLELKFSGLDAATATAWTAAWVAQKSSNSAIASVTNSGTVVSIVLTNPTTMELDQVTLAAASAPNVNVILNPINLGTYPEVAIQANITDSYGNVLSLNGGSCKYDISMPPISIQ